MGEQVVLDVRGGMVFIGKLLAADDDFYTLESADVHDLHQSTTSKERYVLEARKHGMTANREHVLVSAREVVSLSRMADVVAF